MAQEADIGKVLRGMFVSLKKMGILTFGDLREQFNASFTIVKSFFI